MTQDEVKRIMDDIQEIDRVVDSLEAVIRDFKNTKNKLIMEMIFADDYSTPKTE